MSWWTPERILRLINEFKSRPFLWDVNLPDFKNRPKKRKALQEIADIFSDVHRVRSADEIDKKIQNLRVQFRREHRLMMNNRNGVTFKRTSWFGYEPLLFLASSYDPYRNITNDADAEEDDLYLSQVDEETCGHDEENSFLVVGESSGSVASVHGLQKRAVQRGDKKRRWEEASFNPVTSNNYQFNVRDEFSVFGELVANKLRKILNPRSVIIAQHRINAVLFDLEMEQYETQTSASPDVGFYSTGSSFVSAETTETDPCSASKSPSPTCIPKIETSK